MAIGTTANSGLSRSQLIKQAFRLIGIEKPPPDKLQDSIVILNGIIRELDKDINFLWAISETPSIVTLQANLINYSSSEGLPSNILRLETAKFRDSDGTDSPIEILTLNGYSSIQDKYEQNSQIKKIYLFENRVLASRSLAVWPILSEVESQSEVTGTDALNYSCIRNHTSDSDKKPITGSDWRVYWEQSGSSGSAWATATEYVAPELLLLWYRRPLFDFDLSSDNPDLPLGWDKLLMFKLAHILSFGVKAFSADDRRQLKTEIFESESKLQPSKTKVTTDIYDKAVYY
jgi:hypothetical protein